MYYISHNLEVPELSIRLMKDDEESEFEGRVELQLLGVWGSICDRSYWWDRGDAAVICRMIGNYMYIH